MEGWKDGRGEDGKRGRLEGKGWFVRIADYAEDAAFSEPGFIG